MIPAKAPLGHGPISIDINIEVFPDGFTFQPRYGEQWTNAKLTLEPLDQVRMASELLGGVDAMSLFKDPQTRSAAVSLFRQLQILSSVLGGPQGRKS